MIGLIGIQTSKWNTLFHAHSRYKRARVRVYLPQTVEKMCMFFVVIIIADETKETREKKEQKRNKERMRFEL